MNFVKIISKEQFAPDDIQQICDIICKYCKVQYMKNNNPEYMFITDKSLSEDIMVNLVEDIFSIKDNIFIENSLPSDKITSDKYDEIVYEVSKYLHNDMVRKKVKAGWRYGETFDAVEKTSPLIKDFDSLEEQHKELRPDVIRKVVEVIQRRSE